MCFFSLLAGIDPSQFQGVSPYVWWTFGSVLSSSYAGVAALGYLYWAKRRESTLLDLEIQRKDLELKARPAIVRQEYHIATIGYTGCGKTALTWKYTNPLINISNLPPNVDKKQYEKLVSRKDDGQGTLYFHTYVIHDYPGELKTKCREDMQRLDIRALLLVVDVAPARPVEVSAFSQGHIDDQVNRWNASALEFLFGEEIQKHCKKYILFINKLDLLQKEFPGSDEDLEKRALLLYKPVIDSLLELGRRFGAKVKVLTGSAKTGRGCPELQNELLIDILPEDARDESLQDVPQICVTPDPSGARNLGSP